MHTRHSSTLELWFHTGNDGDMDGTSTSQSNFVEYLVLATVGSPRALLRLHRAYLATDLLTIAWLLAQLALLNQFQLAARNSVGEHVFLGFILVPLFGSVFLLPFLLERERQCLHIVRLRENHGEAVDDRVIFLVNSCCGRFVKQVLICKASWFMLCIIWASALPPCNSANGELVFFWQQPVERVPCELFEGVSTLLVFVNAGLSCLTLTVDFAVDHFRENFRPANQLGVARDMLHWLPSYIYGTRNAPPMRSEPTCSICIEDFKSGDHVRLLPCGHHFHADCVDCWLERSGVCPMRCSSNILETVRVAADHSSAVITIPSSPSSGEHGEEPVSIGRAMQENATPLPGSVDDAA